MKALLRDCEKVFGRFLAWASVAAMGIAFVAAIVAVVLGRANVLFATLAVDFLFFGGLAAGGVAASAMIVVAKGKWALPLRPASEASGSFFVPALVLLALVILGASSWAPWAATTAGGWIFVMALRDVALLGLLAFAGWWFHVHVHTGTEATARALVYLLGYAVILSIVVFDVAMRLYDGEQSTVEPALYFVGALLSGLAWSAFIATAMPSAHLDSNGRHDVGKLLFALSTFWAYLVWSAFLPTWYANIPDETALLMLRVAGGYRWVTGLALFATAILPFFVLLPEWSKRNRLVLRASSLMILTGLFAMNALMVLPDLPVRGLGNAALVLLLSAGVGGAFLLAYARTLLRTPAVAAAPSVAAHRPG